jgi:hypothetical protein
MTDERSITRRQLLERFVYGAGLYGVRALATGIPAAVLLDPRRAAAQSAAFVSPQYLILNTSQAGDPINCNAPGTYLAPDIAHPKDPRMAKTSVRIGGASYDAAAPWASLGALSKAPAVLERAAFIHHATGTEQHLHQPEVHGLMGKVLHKDMAISAFAAELAPVLGTIQPQPVVIGTDDSSEAIAYRGRPQPLLNPRSLATVLASPQGPLASLQAMRDRDLDRLNAFFKKEGTPGQRAFLDQYATSQTQVRRISQDLLGQLAAIKDDKPDAQMKAAIVLVRMKVAPVITVKVPFGGDNHFDGDLTKETEQTLSGMATFCGLMEGLGEASLRDAVTFASFNVFGRTLKMQGAGRSHNRHHHLTLIIGKHMRGGVYGGVTKLGDDFGAMPIASSTGKAAADGDINEEDGLPSVGKTLGMALGLPQARVDALVVSPSSGQTQGKAITGALA